MDRILYGGWCTNDLGNLASPLFNASSFDAFAAETDVRDIGTIQCELEQWLE